MPRDDRGGKRKYGQRCVAANCANTHANNVNLHEFSRVKDEARKRAWTQFVKTKRKDWDGPSDTSVICSDHFTLDCYPFKYKFEYEQTGIRPKNARLNDDAIPTIHAVPSCDQNKDHPEPSPSTSKLQMLSPREDVRPQTCSPPKILRRAYVKREASRVSKHV